MVAHRSLNNTHLIRQKKDFSCMQSDGDDSEMENVLIQVQRSKGLWLHLSFNYTVIKHQP